MSLTRTNKSNPCKVCGGTSKGCSYDLSTSIYLCRGDNTNPDFKLTKVNPNSQFGVYVLAENSKTEFTAEEKAAWAARKREEERVRLAKFKALLSVDDRDAKYQALEAELGMFKRHTDDMLARGISNPLELGFRSVKRYQKITTDTETLAGFNKGKYSADTGMLCPVTNVDGKLLGYQIKPDKGDSKYKWLNSGDVSAHLQTQELPINVANQGTEVIGFCEGILKSTVAAKRHNSTFVGASTVGSTPIQIKEVIEKFNLEEVKLFVDAGSNINNSVVATMKNFNDVVTKLGKTVVVADWGQWFDKTESDIDELESIDDIVYRSFEFYVACNKDRSVYTQEVPEVITNTYEVLTDLLDSKHSQARSLNFLNTKGTWNQFQGSLPESQPGVTYNYEFEGIATDIYLEAIKQGYGIILDTSGTGAGKTTAAAAITTDQLHSQGLDKLIYCSKSPRDVTNANLETDFAVLPSRHHGYDFHPEKRSPMGEPILVAHDPENGKPDIKPNCKWLNLFSMSRAKNLELDICGKCEHKKECRTKRGDGFGYKAQIIQTASAEKLRGTVQGLSESIVTVNTLLIVDEYTQSVPWVKSLQITEKDIHAALKKLRAIYYDAMTTDEHPELTAGTKILNTLLNIFTATIEDVKNFKYGMGFYEIQQRMNMENYTDEVIQGLISLYEVETYQDNASFFEQVSKRNMGSEAMIGELMMPQWLGEFMQIVSNQIERASLTVVDGVLTIQMVDERCIENLGHSAVTIYQDATGSRDDLAMRLGIDPSEILEIRQVVKDRAPVNLNQVIGLGQCGNNRRDGLQERLDTFRQWLYDVHGEENVGCIDFKKYARPNDLVHFVDGRGSNRFEKKEVVVSFGLPVTNITSLVSQYEVFTGRVVTSINDEVFQDYLGTMTSAEVIQEAGRLRANRRPDEALEFVVVSDRDLSFMNDLGFTVNKTHIMSYQPELGSHAERVRCIVLESVHQLLKEFPDKELASLTQKEVQERSNLSQSCISRLSRKFGGWASFKRVLSALINGVDPNSINDATRQAVQAAKSYLPYVLEFAPTELSSMDTLLALMPKPTTLSHWEALLEDVPLDLVAKFVKSLILSMPRSMRNDFMVSIRKMYQL